LAGYKGYSMSNNAVKAYDEGRMPLSKWTKTAILEAVESYLKSYGNGKYFSKFENLSKKDLSQFLSTDGEWHHTSKYYNKTVFYSINESAVDAYCNSGEPADFIVYLTDTEEYVSSKKNEKGLFFTRDVREARKMTEYDANYRVKINNEFGKKSSKIKIKN
jgi:hypothetical protein